MKDKEVEPMIRKVSETTIIKQMDLLALEDLKNVTFLKNYSSHFALKFRKSQEGIIYTTNRIKLQNKAVRDLEHNLKQVDIEIINLKKAIRKAKKENILLEKQIKKEVERGKLYDSNLTILKNNKTQIAKKQENLNQEIVYMTSAINVMKSEYDEAEHKYLKVIQDKGKVKDEIDNFKKERKYLESHLEGVQENHDALKNKIKSVVYIMQQTRMEEDRATKDISIIS